METENVSIQIQPFISITEGLSINDKFCSQQNTAICFCKNLITSNSTATILGSLMQANMYQTQSRGLCVQQTIYTLEQQFFMVNIHAGKMIKKIIVLSAYLTAAHTEPKLKSNNQRNTIPSNIKSSSQHHHQRCSFSTFSIHFHELNRSPAMDDTNSDLLNLNFPSPDTLLINLSQTLPI